MVFYFCGFVGLANSASLVPQNAVPIPWLPCYNECQSIENAHVTSMTGFYVAAPSTYVDLGNIWGQVFTFTIVYPTLSRTISWPNKALAHGNVKLV